MIPPNVFPEGSNLAYCVIAGGHKDDKPQDESGTAKVVDPLRHSISISKDDLPFVTTLRSPTQGDLETTPMPPEPGQICAVTFQTGDPTTRVISGIPNDLNQQSNIAGNNPGTAWIKILEMLMTGKRTPPRNVREKKDRGAVVRDKQESGQEWMNSLTQGLASHAAWSQMAGIVLPQVKQIDTAVQQFMNIPSIGNIAQLAGSIMSLANMLKGMSGSQRKRATQNMPPELVTGFDNLLNLIPEVETDGSYIASGRVDENTFMENAVDLLSQVSTMSDLLYTMNVLRGDVSIRGFNNLSELADTTLKANNTYITADTEEGTSTLYLDDLVSESKHFIDVGDTLQVKNYLVQVIEAEQSANTIVVSPVIEDSFVDESLLIYLPNYEYTIDTDDYGPVTMTMDANGNVKPNKQSAAQIQQIIQKVLGILQAAEGANPTKNLFGEAAPLVSAALGRIPPNIRQALISSTPPGLNIPQLVNNLTNGKNVFTILGS